jgi:hypothetical protein
VSQTNQTTLTHALRDGQLEHVVIVQGEPVQAHTSRVAAMCALMLALACAGCQTMERHPRATAFIAGSLVLSAGLALSQHDGHGPVAEPRMSVPLVDCSKGGCK